MERQSNDFPYLSVTHLIDKLILSSLEITKNIEEKYEPIEKLEEINQQLNDHSQILREWLDQEENLIAKKDFYAKVFKGVSDKMLNEKLLSKPTYLPQILKFFRNVLVNFFPYEVEDEHLAEVVHSIFNLEASLYSIALTSNQSRKVGVGMSINDQGDATESLEQQRVSSEMPWRATLKQGDRVDAVKTKHVQQYTISGWSRGYIHKFLNDDPDTFVILFDNEASSSDQIINRYGNNMAPEGTFTDDIEWREGLKPGDEIDCLDSEGVWYKSTALEQREIDQGDGKTMKQMLVGFRVYDEDEGHKVDDEGRKFVGWSNRYDEWRSLTCVTVQRLKTMAKHYKVAGRNFMNYDIMIDDIRDVIQNTKERKIFTVYRHNYFANLKCIADYLNEFGLRGGYERILAFMKVQQDGRKVSLKHIQFLLDFLAKGQSLWHRQFACYFVPRFKDNFEKLLLFTNQANTGPLQLPFAKETLNSIHKAYQSILKRYYTIDSYGNILSELQFQIGFSLLNSDKLEKRISGIKEIIEQIKNSKFQMKKTISAQDIILKLKQENFCERIFGENYHIQLIQRSTEILKFLINERQLGQQEIDYIWSATQRDSQTKMEIYKIIQETAILYKGDDIDYFISKFMTVPPDEFVEKEVECAYELTRFSYKQNSYSQKAAELFWSIATRTKPYKKQIIELACEKFNELIRNWDKEQKGEYVYLCIENIKEHRAPLQSIKILIKILDQMPQYKQNNQPTIYEFSNTLIEQLHLLDLIINDVVCYLKVANELWAKGVINPDNVETTEILDLPYTHRANIYFRLNLLRQLLQYSQMQLQQDHLDILWEQLTQTSKILPDTESFFWWLKLVLQDQNKISPEVMLNFFSQKICKEDVSFKFIKKYGFECIQTMFLQINEVQDKIVLNNPSSINSSMGSMGNNNSNNMMSMNNNNNNNSQQSLEFKIHVPPNELEGINVLWKLLEEVDKKNMELISLIIILITKVYLNLSSVIEDQIHKIGEQFTQECLTRLSHVINDQQDDEIILTEQEQAVKFQEKAQFSKNLSIMMKSFFEDSERNGTGGLRPHLSIEKGDFIQRLVIQNNVTSQKICPKYIQISTYSNMTLWELKKLIAQKTKVSPLKLQLNRADTKKKSLTDNDNIKLLKDLKFESYEQITAQKKPMTFTHKVSLVNRRKELVPEAKRIFEAWFETFSDEGFMTQDTCVDFIKNSTNDPNVNTQDQRVTRLFTEYDKDKDGKLSKEEFLEFYRERAVQKPELVWSNLTAHQYGNDLKHQSFGLYEDDDPLELKDKTHLARYKISTSEHQFSLLFDMMEKGYDDIWSTIICQLRTNPKIYADLLTLTGINSLSSASSNKERYKLLYSLQIMEFFLNEYQVKRTCEVKSYYYQENINNDQHNYPPLPSDNVAGPQSGVNSGVAIPLPAAAASAKNYNIPDAPPVQGSQMMGPLPPPVMVGANVNKGKENKIYEFLDNFQGSVIQEDLSTELFQNEELIPYISNSIEGDINIKYLREQWVPTFLQNGGFQLLIQILTETMSNQTHYKSNDDILKARVDRDCINTILKIMKIILMSSFCANSPNMDLNNQLQRRMSSVVDEEIELFDEKKSAEATTANVDNTQVVAFTSDQQNKLQAEQEMTAKEYEPLIKLLMGDMGEQILQTLDFKQFQHLILQIIQLVLAKEKAVSADDRTIIDQSIQLWISCIVFKPELLELIYENQPALHDIEKGEVQQENNNIARVLIEKGLLGQHYTVRCQFKDALLFICRQVRDSSMIRELPQHYFLKNLISNLDLTLHRSKDAKQYFELLKKLFTLHFEQVKQAHPMNSEHDLFNSSEILKHLASKLRLYQSTEKKGNYTEDYNLSGLIDIINLLINNSPTSILSESEHSELIKEIIERMLFTFEMPPVDYHITKNVDLQVLEKPYLNKCQTTDSRQSAYNLLITIVKECPSHLGDIMSKYWYPLLYKVKKPKKQGYAPKSEGRSYHGFCGIKNLGCICYMNSMIQQFFHIPTFRYCALAADDGQPESMRDFEGDQVDDSMLHQLLKFMGFLELSERQDYNPREFCFSFKDSGGQPTNVRIQQDAQEFLNVAFDRIETQLAKTSQKYLLQNIFGGRTCSMMICKNCGNMRQKFEDFFNLSVEVKNQKTLYDGLKKFIQGEIINDFQCEACNQRVDVQKKTVIQKLPNTLIVHLQRIVFDFDTLQNQKLNSKVEFPNVLNLKPFMLSEVLKEEKELMKKAKKEKKKQGEENKSADIAKSEKQEKMEDEKDEGDEQINTNHQKVQSPDKNHADMASSDDEDEEGTHDKDMKLDDASDADENFEYKLVGVVVHMGTADAGHYISYININRGTKSEDNPEWLKTENDKWLEFNDSLVKDWKFKDLEEDCFGGIHNTISTGQNGGMNGSSEFKNDYSRNAYMLIYEKRKKEKIKLVIPEQLLLQRDQLVTSSLQSLDCDGTAIPRGNQNLLLSNSEELHEPHLLFICPEIRDQIIENRDIFYDEECKENFVLVDFNCIQKFVPNSVYKLVHEDNNLFMCERQIFNNSFFSCTKQMLELVISKAPELLLLEEYSPKLYDFMERMIFDLISMTSENKQLSQLTQLLINMLKQNDEQTISFIKKRILNMPVAGGADEIAAKPKDDKKQSLLSEKSFFELLISNMDKDVREMAQVLITFAVNRLFELNEMELVDQIMNTAFAMMPEELAKNWLKIHQFLTFILDVTRSGRPQLLYMVNKSLIARLIDFYLENESPKAVGQRNRVQMGSNYANPPFESLIITVSYIAQHQVIILPTIGMSEEEYREAVMQAIQDKGRSNCFFTSPDSFSVILNTEDVDMLLLKQFYVKTLKFGFVGITLGQILAHVSFENHDFSFRIAKKILVGINKCSGDEIRPYLDVLELFLHLPDSLQKHRFEWILGVPVIKIERQMQYNNMQPVASNIPKVGVQIISNMNDDIYEYRSTLFKSSTSIKESLLQILYQYRRRWTMFTLQCLQSLFKCAMCDPQKKIFTYLKTLEPPSYSYARYIDWVKPYLEESIQNGMRSQHLHSSKMEVQAAMALYQSLSFLMNPPVLQAPPQQQQQDQDNPVVATIDVDESISSDQNMAPEDKKEEQKEEVKQASASPQSNNQKDTAQERVKLSYDSIDGGPEQYLIWRVHEEVQKDVRMFPQDNISVVVTEFNCIISESKPTGYGNLVLQNNGQNNNSNGRGAFHIQPQHFNGNSNGRLPYGRGSNSRGNQSNQKKQNKGGKGKKNGKGKKSIVCNNKQQETGSIYAGYYDGSATQVDGAADNEMGVGDDANTRAQNDQDIMAVDEEGGAVVQDIQGDVGGAGGAGEDDDEDGEYEEDEIEEYDNSQDTNQAKFDATFQDDSNRNNMDFQEDKRTNHQNGMNDEHGNQQYDQDQDAMNPQAQHQDGIVPPMAARKESNNEEYWQANLGTVLVFTVTNHDLNRTHKVLLTFTDESQEGESLNFKMPITTIPIQVHSNRDKEVIAFTKLRAFEDWGKYSFIATVEDLSQKHYNRNIQAPIGSNMSTMNNQNINTAPANYDPMDVTPAANVQQPDLSQKECPVCTYYNSQYLTSCDMCGSALPP